MQPIGHLQHNKNKLDIFVEKKSQMSWNLICKGKKENRFLFSCLFCPSQYILKLLDHFFQDHAWTHIGSTQTLIMMKTCKFSGKSWIDVDNQWSENFYCGNSVTYCWGKSYWSKHSCLHPKRGTFIWAFSNFHQISIWRRVDCISKLQVNRED